MANNQLLASDNFASGSLAAGWSAVPGQSVCQVVVGPPNFTEANVVGTVAGQIWTGLTWPNDQASEVTVTMTGSAVATTLIQLHVRNQGGGSYSGYRAIIEDSGAWEIDVVTAGTPTVLTSGTGLTIGANDIWVLQAAGSCLALYQNFVRIGYIGDATYTGGSPGYSQEATTTLSTNEVFSWRGYSGVQQDGIWQKQGVVLPANAYQVANGANAGTGTSGPETIVYGPPIILTGHANVYRGWFADDAGIGYAESLDGKAWTLYSGGSPQAWTVLAGYLNGSLFISGGTYYTWSSANGSGPLYMFTSSDGITWSAGTLTNFPDGWGAHVVDVIGGTFYALQPKLDGTGNAPNTYLYTSTDGITWAVQNGGSPVIPNVYVGIGLNKIGGVYYAWANANQPGQGNPTAPGFDPLEGVLYSSTSANLIAGGAWTFVHHSIHAIGMWESLNSTEAGVYLTVVMQMPTMGRVGMYYVGSPGDSTGPQVYQGGLVLAPANSTLANIVAANEDGTQQIASDNFPGSSLSPNWTTPTGVHPLTVSGGVAEVSVADGSANIAVRTGEIYTPNQYSELTITTLEDGNSYLTAGVRALTTAKTLYQLQFNGGTGANTGTLGIYRQIAGVQITLWQFTGKVTPQIGDIFRLTVVDGSDGFPVLTATQNGFSIVQVQDQNPGYLTTGNPALQINASTQADATTALWSGGNANVIPTYPSVGNGSLLLLGVGH